LNTQKDNMSYQSSSSIFENSVSPSNDVVLRLQLTLMNTVGLPTRVFGKSSLVPSVVYITEEQKVALVLANRTLRSMGK
jgi:hypothetical protein